MGQTVNSPRYQAQLTAVAELLGASPMNPIPLLQDNAPCHRARETVERATSLGFDILQHPPYSPDLSPSDYHLFRSLSNSLRNKHFKSKQQVQGFIRRFFGSKPAVFYARGIDSLPARWNRVVKNGGKYRFQAE